MGFLYRVLLRILIGISILVWGGIVVYLFFSKGFDIEKQYPIASLGSVGDIFNIVTSLVSLVTVLLIYSAYNLQKKELSEMRDQLRDQTANDREQVKVDRAIRIIERWQSDREVAAMSLSDSENLKNTLDIILPYGEYLNEYVETKILRDYFVSRGVMDDIEKRITFHQKLSASERDFSRKNEHKNYVKIFTRQEEYMRQQFLINQIDSSADLEYLLSHTERLYWKPVVYSRQESDTLERIIIDSESKFGGSPTLKLGEERPICSLCSMPMWLLVQLNTNNIPEQTQIRAFRGGILQVFQCTSPDCDAQKSFGEPYAEGTGVRLLIAETNEVAQAVNAVDREASFPEKLISSWKQCEEYPLYDELKGMGYLVSDDLYYENKMVEQKFSSAEDKLSGWPYWVQNISYPKCRICKEKMEYIFQISSNDNLTYSFGDAGVAHIFQCSEHWDELTLSWECY